jgi:hypothetical protein
VVEYEARESDETVVLAMSGWACPCAWSGGLKIPSDPPPLSQLVMLPAEARLSPSVGGSLARRVARSAKSGESKMEDEVEPEPEPDE